MGILDDSAWETNVGYILPVHGASVSMIRLDFRFALLILGPNFRLEVTLESPFSYWSPAHAPLLVEPDGDIFEPEILRVRKNAEVKSLKLSKDGNLRLELEGGICIACAPHADYEAWQVIATYPQGSATFIAMPGGELACFG